MHSISDCSKKYAKERKGKMINTGESDAYYGWVVFVQRYSAVLIDPDEVEPTEWSVYLDRCAGAIISKRYVI